MSDETQPAAVGPEIPTPDEALHSPRPWHRHPNWRWAKRLLACNPFYLVSAALLLYGMYRVSIDANVLATEIEQLVFNFSSLQCYELLLVITAILLARRNIWYDATLLVVLENLFILVPFMLISQAALIEQETAWVVWVLCAAAALVALGRSAAARRWISRLTLSPRLLAGGVVVLLANAALPVVYRVLHESKVGTKWEVGAAYEMNEVSWLWLFPTLCALANLLPRPRDDGELLVQRRWFPVSLFLLWIAGTGVHLYSLGYVYDFDLRRELLAPGLWVLAWTLHLRLKDFVAIPPAMLRQATLVLPLAITLLPLEAARRDVAFVLSALNAFAFASVAWADRGHRLALHLALASLAAAVATLPVEVVQPFAGHVDRVKLFGAAALAYLVVGSMLSRNPKVAVGGALAAALAVGLLRSGREGDSHWAVQAGLVFFLLHSLRWQDYEHPGARFVRILAAAVWVAHAFIWVRVGLAFPSLLAMAGGVLVLCGLKWWLAPDAPPLILPAAALLVALCSPANFLFAKLQATPVGIVAIGGSFLLFGLGTIAALTKRRWGGNGQH
jgi:hypothetical protein